MTTITEKIEALSNQFDGSSRFHPFTTIGQADGELSAFAYELRQCGLYSLEAMQKQAFLLVKKLEQSNAHDAAEDIRSRYLVCHPITNY